MAVETREQTENEVSGLMKFCEKNGVLALAALLFSQWRGRGLVARRAAVRETCPEQ